MDNKSVTNVTIQTIYDESGNQSLTTTKAITDKHTDTAVNVSFFIAAIVCIIFSAMSFIAINRTKCIPRTACFLSSSLLFFDCATTLTYATRKFITDSHVLQIITLIGLGWSYASFINVAIMALERLIVFQWPYFYTRRMSYQTSIKILLAVMVVYVGSWTCEWVACFFKTEGFWNNRDCLEPVAFRYMTATFAALLLVIVICFTKILTIIIKQRSKVQPNSETVSRTNRSTIVVFLCCVNYVLTALINIVLVYTNRQVPIVVRRTILDTLYMLNGIADTFVYVLWYRECRYELLKMVAVVVPSLRPKVEQMRVLIFEIMTGETNTSN